MSRTFRLLFFFAAATTLAISAASAASVPVTEAATPVAKPLPGCSAVLSTAVAAADLKKAASRASSSGSGSTDGSSGGSGSTNGSSGGSGSTNGSSSGSGSSNGSSSGSGSSSARSAPYSKTLLANGDFLLETSWQTWECMNGVKARAFLTLRPFPASSSAAARKSDDGGGGFLSAASWKRALAPVPLKCFPSGAAWTNVGLAVYGMGNHIVNLLSPEFGRLPMRGFGTTLLFASALFLGRRGGGGRSSFFLLLLLPVRAAALFSPRSSVFSFSLSFSFE